MFSLVPRSHGWWGWQKQAGAPSASWRPSASENSLPCRERRYGREPCQYNGQWDSRFYAASIASGDQCSSRMSLTTSERLSGSSMSLGRLQRSLLLSAFLCAVDAR